MKTASEIQANYKLIEAQAIAAALSSGRRAADVQLVAVSKYQPSESMQALVTALNAEGRQPVFGESYVQEFKKKKPLLSGSYKAHLIGTLQSNKAKDAVRYFDLIESVHTLRIVEALQAAAEKERKTQPIFLQINISDDQSKQGFSRSELAAFIKNDLTKLTAVRLEGLMTITRFYDEAEAVRPDYRAMRELRDELAEVLGRPLLLSMGMSADFTIAIEEGADLVRVGTAIFGERG